MELLGHRVCVSSTLLDSAELFSKMSIYISPISMYECVFPSLHTLEIFHHPKQKLCTHQNNNAPFLLPLDPVLLSVSISLPVLGTSYKGNHIGFWFVCFLVLVCWFALVQVGLVLLISLSLMFSRFVYVIACVRISL